MDYVKRAREVIQCEMDGMKLSAGELGTSFEAAVDAMLASLGRGGKIVVTGIGKNLHIAQKVSGTLASTGATSVVLNPTQAMHGDLGILRRGDVLLALSYSGESEELVALVPPARRMGVTIVAITGATESTLATGSDTVIPIRIEREACPFNMAPTASTTATLAVGDALAMVLLDAQGMKRDDYAKLHPGGAIGRSLLLKVGDIMRRDDRLPAVHQDATVQDALLAMTKAKSGSAGIVDDEGRVVGIFTDGDLRRRIGDHENILAKKVEAVMTPSPITVCEDALAIEVLNAFERHSIDDLLVVDRAGRLKGVIDSQDLPKLKIV